MKLLIKLGVLLLLVGSCAAAYRPAVQLWKSRNRPNWRLAEVTQGDVESVVNSTGTVQPVQRVQVGSFASGPVLEVLVDFNEHVEKGQLLAKIDPRLFQANVDRDKATLATRRAEVERSQALLTQAENEWKRARSLFEDQPVISIAEMDQYQYNYLSQKAQLTLSESSVEQAQANLKNSEANLEYCSIRSPVSGIIIDRKIDPGQTVAASFQTPELFIVAPDMESRMHVYASVDEADIGYIRRAKREKRRVHFTVDAYPDDLFEGVIEEVRFSSTTTQNVVTYPVIVAAKNPELKLLPGMTANLSFEIAQRNEVLKVPNSALRFYPEIKHVHPDDRSILDGAVDDSNDQTSDAIPSAVEVAEARRERNRRHVWVVEDDFLRAVEVVTGLNDSKHSELLEGDLKEGQSLVTGIKPKETGF